MFYFRGRSLVFRSFIELFFFEKKRLSLVVWSSGSSLVVGCFVVSLVVFSL